VAPEPAYRTRLLGAILVLETADREEGPFGIYNELRARLGLPVNEAIDLGDASASRLPLVRLSRLVVEKLSDEQLLDAYKAATLWNVRAALRPLVTEVVNRPGLDDKVDKAHAYGTLARLEDDGGRAISYVAQARVLAERAGASTARWDLEELRLHLEQHNGAEAARLFDHLQRSHLREPGVAEALAGLLMSMGIMRPDGSFVEAEEEEKSPILVPGGAGAPGKLWTPGGDQPAGEKRAIWTPGG
jgi:hypothetical protein